MKWMNKKRLERISVIFMLTLFINLPVAMSLEISGVQAESITQNSAVISWDTDEEANSFVEFGEEQTRKVRLLVSPETTGEKKFSIVVTSLPPLGVADGHIHEKGDEYICFDIGGKYILNGKEYQVEDKGIVFAPMGSLHECLNTSEKKELTLVCFFIPALKPYGKYPELIKKTKEFIEKENKE